MKSNKLNDSYSSDEEDYKRKQLERKKKMKMEDSDDEPSIIQETPKNTEKVVIKESLQKTPEPVSLTQKLKTEATENRIKAENVEDVITTNKEASNEKESLNKLADDGNFSKLNNTIREVEQNLEDTVYINTNKQEKEKEQEMEQEKAKIEEQIAKKTQTNNNAVVVKEDDDNIIDLTKDDIVLKDKDDDDDNDAHDLSKIKREQLKKQIKEEDQSIVLEDDLDEQNFNNRGGRGNNNTGFTGRGGPRPNNNYGGGANRDFSKNRNLDELNNQNSFFKKGPQSVSSNQFEGLRQGLGFRNNNNDNENRFNSGRNGPPRERSNDRGFYGGGGRFNNNDGNRRPNNFGGDRDNNNNDNRDRFQGGGRFGGNNNNNGFRSGRNNGGYFNREFDRETRYSGGGNTNNRRVNNDVSDPILFEGNKELIQKIQSVFKHLSINKIISLLKQITEYNLRIFNFELMNKLKREDVIEKNLNDIVNNSHVSRNFNEEVRIYEVDRFDIDESFTFMVEKYKTFKSSSSLDDINEQLAAYKGHEDRRRKVLRDEEGYYSYIPVKCQTHFMKEGSNQDNCRHAHNDYEINYHPLVYKTSMCLNSNCKRGPCHMSHNPCDDFLSIFTYNDVIVDLFQDLTNSKLLASLLTDYTRYTPNPTAFSLKDFKVKPCTGACFKDPHLCYLYHDLQERRRPPNLYKYLPNKCNDAFPERSLVSYPQYCSKKDFCQFIHTRYEHNYHREHYQKQRECMREVDSEGKCVYLDTCYGMHIEGSKRKIVEVANKSNCLKNCKELFKKYRCRRCDEVPTERLCVLTKCNHIICDKCMEASLPKESKRVRNCPACDEDIPSRTVIRVYLRND